MKLATMELADHTAAARRFKSKFFLAKDWDLTADFQARVVWVTGKDAQGKQGRWWFPFEQVVYGEPVEVADSGIALRGADGTAFKAAQRDEVDVMLGTVKCPRCFEQFRSGAGLAAHVRSKHTG